MTKELAHDEFWTRLEFMFRMPNTPYVLSMFTQNQWSLDYIPKEKKND